MVVDLAREQTDAEVMGDHDAEEWRDYLLARLIAERDDQLRRVRWYLGKQPVPEVPKKYAAAYRLILDMSRNAWARLVVDSIAERVKLVGVQAADGSGLDLWRIFKGNRLDVDQRLVHSEALTLSRSYLSVWNHGGTGDAADVRIVPESATQVIHESDPEDSRLTIAALKVWRDDRVSKTYATLYLPESIYRWEAETPKSLVKAESEQTEQAEAEAVVQALDVDAFKWQQRDEFEQSNPLGAVPMVPFSNRPTLFAGGQSEIDDIEPVLSRIDKLVLDMLLAAEVGAFRQKWATGLDVPIDPDTKKPIEPFDAAVSKLFVSPSESTSFGSFEATDLGPYLNAIDAQIAEVSAISRVPSYYLVSPNLVNPPSADALIAAEAGLIHKAEGLMTQWSDAYEITLRLALRSAGDDRAEQPGLDMVFASAALPNEAALADAAVKWSSLGVPEEALWQKGGATPEEVARWKAIQAREALSAQVFGQPTTVDEAEAAGEDLPENESQQETAAETVEASGD